MSVRVTIPEVPNDVSPKMRKFLQALRDAVLAVSPTIEPMRQISNLQVTPVAGGNRIRFTKSNGENYTLYMSNTASLADATFQPLGDANDYTDYIGEGGKKRYYWVIATADGKTPSDPVGPITGTTLALGTSTSLPVPPPTYDDYTVTSNYKNKYDIPPE